ncbi:MAG: hypothetical protein H7308_04225 [Chthonomonadaceae bacterium]|nr:hypothetical protein [Chthonomonadaceae bacterium]
MRKPTLTRLNKDTPPITQEVFREWSLKTSQAYQTTLDVREVTQVQEDIVVMAQVAGTFEGSPIQLRFHFTLRGDKISALTIGI